MTQVPYHIFCLFRGLSNPRFFTRRVYSQGKYWYTQYWDAEDGELYRKML